MFSHVLLVWERNESEIRSSTPKRSADYISCNSPSIQILHQICYKTCINFSHKGKNRVRIRTTGNWDRLCIANEQISSGWITSAIPFLSQGSWYRSVVKVRSKAFKRYVVRFSVYMGDFFNLLVLFCACSGAYYNSFPSGYYNYCILYRFDTTFVSEYYKFASKYDRSSFGCICIWFLRGFRYP